MSRQHNVVRVISVKLFGLGMQAIVRACSIRRYFALVRIRWIGFRGSAVMLGAAGLWIASTSTPIIELPAQYLAALLPVATSLSPSG